MSQLAYHFTGPTLRDGRPLPAIGEWLEHKGPLIPCESGLHACLHPWDALQYAPGVMLHLVEVEGEITPNGNPPDKLCCRRRRILASIDTTGLLRAYARWCALQVVTRWDAPPVVVEYLRTGREDLCAAASIFAWTRLSGSVPSFAARAARLAARAAGTTTAGVLVLADAVASARNAREDAHCGSWSAREAHYTSWGVQRAWEAQRDHFAGLVNAAFQIGGAK